MDIQTPGLHHLALRVTDLQASRHFYGTTLGFPVILEGPGIFLFLAGRTAIAVRAADGQTAAGDAFDPHRVGLDHLALACCTEPELRRVAAALARADVPNTGLKVDPTLNRAYVAFKDPDGIAWEYYMAPDTTQQAVRSYFDALARRRIDTIPFSAAVVFVSPLSPPLRGTPAVSGFLEEVLPAVSDIGVHQVIVDGEHAAAHVTVETGQGQVPSCDYFRVVNGEIVELRSFYDPRSLLSSRPFAAAGAAAAQPLETGVTIADRDSHLQSA